MNESRAVVTGIDGAYALVELRDSAGCGQCANRAACGGEERGTRRILNTAGARVGDEILLQVADGAVLKAAMTVYGYPLVAALAGAAVGMGLWRTDGAALAGFLTGLIVGILLARPARRRMECGREPLMAMRLKAGNGNFDKEPSE